MFNLFALISMLMVLTVTSLCASVVTVLAPRVAAAAEVDATAIGVYVALNFLTAMLAGSASGIWVQRLGAVRVLQVSMILAWVSMLLASTGTVVGLVASAALLGAGVGPFNPASAQILLGVSSARWQPLVFSFKQCGVPLGGTLAGALAPTLTLYFGWEMPLYAVGAGALVAAAILQPLRARFDHPSPPSGATHGADSGERQSWLSPVRLVTRDRDLRLLTLAASAYSAVQLSAVSFHVVYLTGERMQWSLADAGLAFAAFQGAGVVGRLLWGSIAGQLLAPATVLIGLGAVTSVALVLLAHADPHWSLPLVIGLSAVMGLAGMGWNGILLSEVARAAPVNRAVHATAGLQFFMFLGAVVTPPVFAGIIRLTDGYRAPYLLLVVFSVVGSVLLLQYRSMRAGKVGR
jgi:MFS family permease